MTQAIGIQSHFSFFDGERVLMLIAPDDPEAQISRHDNARLWKIETRTAAGEVRGERSVSQNSSPEHMWHEVKSVLYQTVSSSEVDKRYAEIEDWVSQVYQAYQDRSARIKE